MATSGTANYSGLKIKWNLKSQSAVTNSSTISYKIYADWTGSKKVTKFKFKMDFGLSGELGEKMPYSLDSKTVKDGTILKEGTFTVPHYSGKGKYSEGTDGAGIMNFYVEGIVGDVELDEDEHFYNLPTINRRCVISTADNFWISSGSPKITFTNPTGGKMDNLSIRMNVYGTGAGETEVACITARALSKTATSYTYTFTAAEWDTIRSKTKNFYYSGMKAKFIITTTFSGQALQSSKVASIQATASGLTPSVNINFIENNSLVKSLYPTNPNKYFIQNVSNVSYTSTIGYKYGATALSSKPYGEFFNEYHDSTHPDKLTTGTWGGNPISENYSVRTYDSRGIIGTGKGSINVITYNKPIVKVRNIHFDGTDSLKFGIYGSINVLPDIEDGRENTPTVYYRIHEVDEEFDPTAADWGEESPWTLVEDVEITDGDVISYAPEITIDSSLVDVEKNYVIQAKTSDLLTEKISVFQYAKKLPVLDFDENTMRLYNQTSFKENTTTYREGYEDNKGYIAINQGACGIYGIGYGYITGGGKYLQMSFPIPTCGAKNLNLREIAFSIRTIFGEYPFIKYNTGTGTAYMKLSDTNQKIIENGSPVYNGMIDSFYVGKEFGGNALRVNIQFSNAICQNSSGTAAPNNTVVVGQINGTVDMD